ncbi:signal peptidase I [Cohnella suwonensis]|uniref:Signal peptidase I n=1 Tax=Cohnella suwonensis TaxID=696072 RepID=A0ABW0M5Z2_9BACL
MKKGWSTVIGLAILCVTLSGCVEKKPVKDEATKQELPAIETLKPNEKLHWIGNDGMAESVQFTDVPVVVDLSAYKGQPIARGDVVYFQTDAGSPRSGFDVARVVGLPGERVIVEDGQIRINGGKLEAFYGIGPLFSSTKLAAEYNRDIEIPDNEYFIVGDAWQRNFSGSFVEGPIAANRIKGQVVGWVDRHLYSDDPIPESAQVRALLERGLSIGMSDMLQLLNALTGLEEALTVPYTTFVGKWFLSDMPHMVQAMAMLGPEQTEAIIAIVADFSATSDIERIILDTGTLLEGEWVDRHERDTVLALLTAIEAKGDEIKVPEEEVTPEESPQAHDEQTAIEDTAALISALKQRDAEKVKSLVTASDYYGFYGLEEAQEIVRGFEANFDLETLRAVADPMGLSHHPAIGQYAYRLEDDGNNSKPQAEANTNESLMLTVRYESDGGVVYNTPYISYFPFAERMATQYIELIQGNKAEELTGFLNPDDLEIPVEVAERTIALYAKAVDLKSAAIRYVGGFDFVVEDKKGAFHPFTIVYGDGLMGIQDEYVEYPG